MIENIIVIVGFFSLIIMSFTFAFKKYMSDRRDWLYCKWAQTEDYDRYYDSECRNQFFFSEDGPTENGFVYCPFCGRRIKIISKVN